MRLLLFTNGSAACRPALEYGVALARRLGWPTRLIGIDEDGARGRRGRVDEDIGRASETLRADRIPVESDVIAGAAEAVVAAEADGADALAILGPLGRRGWRRWLRGPSIRHILHAVQIPALYVPKAAPLPVARILMCSGGLSHAENALHLGGRLAASLDLPVTLLHIVVPTLNLPAQVNDEAAPPAEYLDGDTLFARNLRKGVEDLEALGLAVDFRLRTGDPLTEILAEIRSASYDLVVIGSHEVLDGPGRLVGSITAPLAERAGCPVLIVPGPQSPAPGAVSLA